MKRFIDLSSPPSIGSCESIHEARGVLWNPRMLEIYPFQQRMRAVTWIARAFRCAWVKWVNLQRARVPKHTSAWGPIFGFKKYLFEHLILRGI